jgi:hypothetical protein
MIKSHLILCGAVSCLQLLTKGEQRYPQGDQFPLLERLSTIFSVIQKHVLSLSEFDTISIIISICLCTQNTILNSHAEGHYIEE